MIFTTKSLIYSCIGATFGFIFYYIFKIMLNMNILGIIAVLIFAAIGYGIAMLRIPDSNNFEITRKAGGESIDGIVLRILKFKKKKNRIYVYTKEEK